MSQSSGASSGASRGRCMCDGIPEKCWCDNGIVTKMSKSESNPCRRYFRCEFAYANKMVNDNHLFKWVDEALVFDVKKLKTEIDALKEEIKENQKIMEAMYEKMENGVLEAKTERANLMKKMLIVISCGVLLMVGVSKLVFVGY